MRIIGGSLRGMKLFSPSGSVTRPTRDGVRETVFNVLGPLVEDATFLDLFAGTGAMGLEALSRGARQSVFVESHPDACRTIEKNLEKAKAADRGRVVRWRAEQVARRGTDLPEAPFNLVYADPPYAGWQGEKLAELFRGLAAGLLSEDAMLVVERDQAGETFPWLAPLATSLDTRISGRTALAFARLKPSPP